jgi:hypothetical protein
MSLPEYKGRTIPLYLADQAVAACNKEIAELKAEVQRLDQLCRDLHRHFCNISCENIILRKAGDAMASSIQFNEEMARDYNGPAIVHQSVQRWNAAKDGKATE